MRDLRTQAPQRRDVRFAEDQWDDDFIDLGHLWRVVWGYKWNILALASIVSIIAILVALPMRPVYQSTATILIEKQTARVVSIEEVYSGGGADWEYLPTQVEIMRSRALVERAVDKLDIRHHPDYDPDIEREAAGLFSWFTPVAWVTGGIKAVLGGVGLAPPTVELAAESEEALKHDAVVDAVAGGMSIGLMSDTQLATVSFEAHDPKLAADVVNTIAEQFIESHLDGKLAASQKAISWLSERMEVLRGNLNTAEQNLQAYRDDAGLVEVSGVKTVSANELEEVSKQLVLARRARTEAESVYNQVQSLGTTAPRDLVGIPAVLSHSLVQNFKQMEADAQREVSELRKRYGPLHPKMIAAVSQRDSAQRDLYRQIEKVVAGVAQDFELARQNELALQGQLAAVKGTLQDINRKEFRLRELQRNVETNRQLYDMFFSRLKETDQASGLEAAHARVIDPGQVPRSPIKPRKTLIVSLAFILATMAGVGLALLLDFLDNTLKSPGDVEERLQVPVLGAIPMIKSVDSKLPLTAFLEQKQSSFAEAVRTVRTGLVLSGLDQPHKIIVVTSSVPGEGKSTVSISLASALGQMENTLLIDADMRRPTLAKVCHLPPNSPGLSNYVAGTASLDECIHHHEAADVDVLIAGLIPSNPLELLSSQRFVEVLEQFKQRYSRIIIDSGPMQAVSDALVLASYADSVVYVAKADSTPHTLARHCLDRLLHSNAPVTGVVLNQFDASKAAKYGGGYYHYGGYYDHYGDGPDEADTAHNVTPISDKRGGGNLA